MKRKNGIGQIIVVTILAMLALTIILPFLNIFALSFNEGADASKGGIYFWPRAWTLANFYEVFKESTVLQATLVSVFRTVVGTFCSVLLTGMAAYALTCKTLPGKKAITFFIFFTMLFSGGIIPYYMVLKGLRLTNTIWVYIIPSFYSVWNLLIMRTFFNQIPASLLEAARIDGCSEWKIFFTVVLPMSKPVLMTIGMFNAVSQWNDWFTGAFFVRDSSLRPLATLLQEMLSRQEAMSQALLRGSGNYDALTKMTLTGDSLKMATIIIVVLPMLLIYPFIQKHFVKGINIGSVKE